MVREGVEKRFKTRPIENMKTPDPIIAVPLMQALSYTAQNETLREMYLNLLANSMDKSQDRNVHPSFVGIIKQMDSLDAKLFKKLPTNGYMNAINPRIDIVGQTNDLVGETPKWFMGITIDDYDIFQISASLVRLTQWGLVGLTYDATTGSSRPEQLKQSPLLVSILERCIIEHPALELEIQAACNVIYVSDYGKQFIKSCL
jgi:hypothetical protein